MSAVFQAVYAGVQAFGYDPAWYGTRWRADMQPIGSIRSTNMLAIYLAVLAPLAPPIAAGILVGGILLSKSALGLLAVSAGLLVRYRARLGRGRARWAWVGLTAVVTLGLVGLLHQGPQRSALDRLGIWRVGLADALGSPVFGWGMGGWAERVPPRVLYTGRPSTEFPTAAVQPTHAHNELVQWAHEGGLLGLLIVAIGLWWHRGLWRHPSLSGAVMAGVIACLLHAPLHLATTALPIIVIYGLATAPGGLT